MASALVLVLLGIMSTRLTFTRAHTHKHTLMHLRTLKHNCIGIQRWFHASCLLDALDRDHLCDNCRDL